MELLNNLTARVELCNRDVLEQQVKNDALNDELNQYKERVRVLQEEQLKTKEGDLVTSEENAKTDQELLDQIENLKNLLGKYIPIYLI